jgi:hypothetical protein
VYEGFEEATGLVFGTFKSDRVRKSTVVDRLMEPEPDPYNGIQQQSEYLNSDICNLHNETTRVVQKVIGLGVLRIQILFNLEYFYMYSNRKMFSTNQTYVF